MKMLRKILGVPSTYVNRAWTNQAVLHELSQRHGYKHIRLSTKWKHKKITLLGHIIRAESEDPMREVLFETGTFRPRVEHIRRVGKPRANWLIETYKDAHTIIDNVTPFDINDIQQIQTLHGKAQRRETPFTTSQSSWHWSTDTPRCHFHRIFHRIFQRIHQRIFSSNKSNHHVPVCTLLSISHFTAWLTAIHTCSPQR